MTNLEFTLDNAPNKNSQVRLFEMRILDGLDYGIRIQFARDWKIYSLQEALMYLQGYESNGEVPRGTTSSARNAAEDIWIK